MRQHHNVLYVTTPKSFLRKRDEAVEVLRDGQAPARIPLHHVGAIVCFGPVTVSPYLAEACAERGVGIVFLTVQGRFIAQLVGPQSGNVLLRRSQYRAADDAEKVLHIARSLVFGKLANCRTVLRRAARETEDAEAERALTKAADSLGELITKAKGATEVGSLRGIEGAGALCYFGTFSRLLRGEDGFVWQGRKKRPPTDPVNSAMGFIYALVGTECVSAAQAAGLDPQVGFLHVEKPGRPALQLDLMEEFRPVLGDRLLFALVNRHQLKASHFERQVSGAVGLTPDGRRLVVTAYQERRRELLQHPFIGEETTYGILPMVQARLLARHLRGDLDAYPPFLLS